MDTSDTFHRNRHVQYFASNLRQLPAGYSKLDTNRLTLVHFCVHALDLLGELESQVDASHVIEWIYSLQQVSGGFCGSPFVGNDITDEHHPYAHSHIAMTYTALASLVALGDDLSRVDKEAVISNLRGLQRENGSFQAVLNIPSEFDMRFLYCACAISYMLNDWRGVNKDLAVDYIKQCISFDGGIALLPGQEGHGGSTFCGVASLVLMNRLDEMPLYFSKDLIRWCVSRQVGGMQGRPNKLEDTCYSYWIGGTLQLLNCKELLDQCRLNEYVMTCQTSMGGFSKVFGAYPDVLHSFYSMAWLSLSDNEDSPGLKQLNCTLGICQERADMFEGDVP